MIIDLERFLTAERPHWAELEKLLERIESHPGTRLPLDEVQRFHFLYQRTAADLAKINTFASEPETRRYLESLVSRAYGEVHETRQKRSRLAPFTWFFKTLPRTFRKHIRAFWVSIGITLVGCLFGGLAIGLDPESKPALMPFEHLQLSPAERVAREEQTTTDHMEGAKSTFSAYLMTHNTRVSIMTMASGMTYGVGTLLLLFYNGVILGAVAVDYAADGQVRFLLGWLLPHGAIEIPAILIAGQAGLVLAFALIGWGKRVPLRTRLREVSPDLMTLIFGVGLLLVWAGFVESFLSQYHEPVLPYSIKIAFGLTELVLLILFLSRSGRTRDAAENPAPENPSAGTDRAAS
jgi:uncharacterized membrane protein SpoIIM required for sporulation